MLIGAISIAEEQALCLGMQCVPDTVEFRCVKQRCRC